MFLTVFYLNYSAWSNYYYHYYHYSSYYFYCSCCCCYVQYLLSLSSDRDSSFLCVGLVSLLPYFFYVDECGCFYFVVKKRTWLREGLKSTTNAQVCVFFFPLAACFMCADIILSSIPQIINVWSAPATEEFVCFFSPGRFKHLKKSALRRAGFVRRRAPLIDSVGLTSHSPL